MKKGNWFIPAFFAVFISVLLIITIPLRFEKYRLNHLRTWEGMTHESYYFADLDGDGNDELIDCGGVNADGTRDNSCGLRFFRENELRAIDQLNVNELIIGQRQAFITDYDTDGRQEVSVLGVENHDMSIHVFEWPELNEPILKIRLDSLARDKGRPMINVSSVFERDVNGDGYMEFFFYLSAGFPIYPRRSYRLDVKNGILKPGPISSAGFKVDWSKSNNPIYLTGNTTSAGNHEDSVDLPYPDLYSYVFAMDVNLEFLFEPIRCNDYPLSCQQAILDSCLFTLTSREGRMTLEKRLLPNGNLINSINLTTGMCKMLQYKDKLALSSIGNLIFLDRNLNEIDRIDDTELGTNVEIMDFNNDGKDEYFSKIPHRNVANIFSSNFDYPLKVEVGVESGTPMFLFRNLSDGTREFVVHRDNQLDFYSYQYNPYFWLRWPYYLLVFSVTGFASAILFRRFRKNIEKKYEQERQLSRLQLLSIKNQVDPHFTLNALNSIDWMYRNNETDQASSFMGKLSRLMNQTVQSSDKIGCTLYEELDFCRNYCELEKLRADDFSYTIDINESIDAFEIELPKQLVFTHVENAIKHGLRPKEGEKHLSLKVTQTSTGIEITVTDNGVGFTQNTTTSGTGKGLKIAEEMVELWERLKGVTVEVQIEPEEEVSGTKVRMRLQV